MNLDSSGASTSKMEGKGSIVDDFMYGSNVATAHVYIRMGTCIFTNYSLIIDVRK